ncbi:HEAT repeat domain-containing protein [Desulfonema magnum]|uniref:HEAT repeat domain-containing protein n=1 Tax=Desulfonema magnum TaxID=45655 RepID=A0A975GNQ9_9BACT|nr:HEAT repeat domain-containing protein [Desulfonema magnum]QTA88034.1 HEAT repeat domain-containing protein [Desulfonema magnum]
MNELLKALNSFEEVERIYAAQDIAETKRPDMTVYLLNRLLLEESHAVRDAIVFALKNLPCSEIYDMLFKLFHSPDAYLRNAAIGIFGSEGNEALAFLISYMDHADGEVRKLILDALFATSVPRAIEAIRQAIDDSFVNVQITAVEYLGHLEDNESADKMIKLFQKKTEPMLRIAILEFFYMVGSKTDIMKIFSFLAPDDNFNSIDPLYLPQLINLSAKSGDADMICKILDSITHIEIYAEDIIHAIEQANRQFKDICKNDRIIEHIKRVMKKIKDQEVRALCEELLRC